MHKLTVVSPACLSPKTPLPRYCTATASHAEAVAPGSPGASTNGAMGLVTGEVGAGKTVACAPPWQTSIQPPHDRLSRQPHCRSPGPVLGHRVHPRRNPRSHRASLGFQLLQLRPHPPLTVGLSCCRDAEPGGATEGPHGAEPSPRPLARCCGRTDLIVGYPLADGLLRLPGREL
jgi:hypothetical protein